MEDMFAGQLNYELVLLKKLLADRTTLARLWHFKLFQLLTIFFTQTSISLICSPPVHCCYHHIVEGVHVLRIVEFLSYCWWTSQSDGEQPNRNSLRRFLFLSCIFQSLWSRILYRVALVFTTPLFSDFGTYDQATELADKTCFHDVKLTHYIIAITTRFNMIYLYPKSHTRLCKPSTFLNCFIWSRVGHDL